MDSLEEPNNRYRSSSVSTFLYAPRNSLSQFGTTTVGSGANNYASIPRSENETYQKNLSRKYQKYQKYPRRPSDRPEVLAKVLVRNFCDKR
uniref:Uncharacterized protein n=1 Tax=Panagrolaimus davidi TaxID=227884 RepID=A0A914Q1X3_9BILA